LHALQGQGVHEVVSWLGVWLDDDDDYYYWWDTIDNYRRWCFWQVVTLHTHKHTHIHTVHTNIHTVHSGFCPQRPILSEPVRRVASPQIIMLVLPARKAPAVGDWLDLVQGCWNVQAGRPRCHRPRAARLFGARSRFTIGPSLVQTSPGKARQGTAVNVITPTLPPRP
jgi:hypothetical protein